MIMSDELQHDYPKQTWLESQSDQAESIGCNPQMDFDGCSVTAPNGVNGKLQNTVESVRILILVQFAPWKEKLGQSTFWSNTYDMERREEAWIQGHSQIWQIEEAAS